MVTAIAINGSPRMERGNTALLLNSFVEGMENSGAKVEVLYASKLKVQPCACGRLLCWNELDGECCIQDSMQEVYPKLKQADILVLATPMYIPLPGEMQNMMNRLVPLMAPDLAMKDGRTRVRMRDDVRINKVVLVGVSGWWEMENLDTLVRIVKEFAADASVEFAGALLRPHSYTMRSDGGINAKGQAVLDAAKRAGVELATYGKMNKETLKLVSQSLVPRSLLE